MTLDFDDEMMFGLLVDVCDQYSISPVSSIESENYFRKLLTLYEGERDTVAMAIWLGEQIRTNFIAIEERPKWIQSPNWPIINDQPMVFVGQIDVKDSSKKVFHDDTTFYIFVHKETPPVVVMQQY